MIVVFVHLDFKKITRRYFKKNIVLVQDITTMKQNRESTDKV